METSATTALWLVVMGVSGCGKSSLGQGLAAEFGLPLIEGDDFHPEANIRKMSSGIPLDDADRAGWLARLGEELAARPGGAVLTCSALKRAYRDRIRQAGEVRFLHLAGSRAVIAARMAARQGHYMPTSLLDSQFAALEPPGPDEDAITIDIDQPLAQFLAEALARL